MATVTSSEAPVLRTLSAFALLLWPMQAAQLGPQSGPRPFWGLRGGQAEALGAPALGTSLQEFMDCFRGLEAAAQTTCLPGPFGLRPSQNAIRKRRCRIAFREAYEMMESAHAALGEPSESLDYALSSAALLRQLAVLLGDGGTPTDVPPEVLQLRCCKENM